MISFQATPCLDALSNLVGKDVRFLVITFVQSKLNDLPPLPFWQIPVFDSTCVSADLKHDGTMLAEERGGIWSYPSDDNHWSLPYLGDLLDGNGYAIRIYEFALQQIVDGLWQQKVKPPKNVEFTGKELMLVSPRQLVLKAQGNIMTPYNETQKKAVGRWKRKR